MDRPDRPFSETARAVSDGECGWLRLLLLHFFFLDQKSSVGLSSSEKSEVNRGLQVDRGGLSGSVRLPLLAGKSEVNSQFQADRPHDGGLSTPPTNCTRYPIHRLSSAGLGA